MIDQTFSRLCDAANRVENLIYLMSQDKPDRCMPTNEMLKAAIAVAAGTVDRWLESIVRRAAKVARKEGA